MEINTTLLQFLQNALNPIGYQVTATPEDILLRFGHTTRNLGLSEVIDIVATNCNREMITCLVEAYLHLIKLANSHLVEIDPAPGMVKVFQVTCDGFVASVVIGFHQQGCQINMSSEIS